MGFKKALKVQCMTLLRWGTRAVRNLTRLAPLLGVPELLWGWLGLVRSWISTLSRPILVRHQFPTCLRSPSHST